MPGKTETIRKSLPKFLGLSVLLAAAITLLAVMIEPNVFREMLVQFAGHPLLFLLNLLPVWLVLLLLGLLLGNLFWGAALTELLVCGLSLASTVKIALRYEAVYPRDLLLLREVGSALGSYDIDFRMDELLVVLGLAVGLVVLGFIFRPRPAENRRRERLVRLLGALGSAGILLLLTVTVYASDALYYGFPTPNYYDHIVTYNAYGLPYSFVHNVTAYGVDKPAGYDRAEAEAWDSAETISGQGEKVHVIFVMNEAFSALTELPVFDYDAADDPLKNLHRLQQDDHAVSGWTVVPNLGGGTSNTEFDVVTGMQSDALSDSTSIAFGAVSRKLDSIFRVFSDDGYETNFIHPSVGWFYNRENTYEKLGVEKMIFEEDMEDMQTKGSWATDDYVASVIQREYEAAVAQNTYLCSYTTTFQNHMSYTANKYGADYRCQPLSLTQDLSPEAETVLEVYVEGIRDADAMLGTLTDYFDQREEPVILAFFGDHMPSLGDAVYTELGVPMTSGSMDPSERFYVYSTPYLLWVNDAGAAALDWENAVEALDLPEDGHISACYLGAMVLELTGRGEETSWFGFLNQLRRMLPVVHGGVYLDAEGVISTTLGQGQQSQVDLWRKWSYYKLKQKKISERGNMIWKRPGQVFWTTPRDS